MSAECAFIYKSSPLRGSEWHILLNKFHTKINELNRQKRAIAADPLCDWRAIFLSNTFNSPYISLKHIAREKLHRKLINAMQGDLKIIFSLLLEKCLLIK